MICNTNEEKLPMLFIPAVEQSVPGKDILSREYAVYIHIPFCVGKCHFCSIPTTNSFDATTIDAYLNTLISEMYMWEKTLSGGFVVGVHIGGGTPSVLSPQQIKRLFDAIYEIFGKELQEITFESNPASLTREKIDVLARYNSVTVNMGIQSFVRERLEKINRYGNIEKIKDTIRYVQEKENLNFGIDLIVGLPGSTKDDYDVVVDCISKLDIKNVFIYPYRLERNSFFYENQREISAFERGEIIAQMEYTEKLMSEIGFTNKTAYYWTKEDKKLYLYAIHQMKGGEWAGIGAGAYSYIDNAVIYHESSLDRYLSLAGELFGKNVLRQSISAQLIWDITFLIRQTGFDFEVILKKYGKISHGYICTLAKKLSESGYCHFVNGKGALTVKGKVMLDDVEVMIREVVLN